MMRGVSGIGVVCVLGLAACTDGELVSVRLDDARDILLQAEQHGAYACAPREMALARANLEFAEMELLQGRPGDAEDHAALATLNARAAYALSPEERCDPSAQPPPTPTDGDRDGDGLSDAQDACPDDAEDSDGFGDDDGCPDPDNDRDGIADALDRCPLNPEDPDGFADEDGCPDPDNDDDGLADGVDQCPVVAGPTASGGCPRVYENVELTGSAIRIQQQVHFEQDRAVIRAVSFPLLKVVAQVLADYPNMSVEVQGHTDSAGNDDYNMQLSQDRANSVRDYLLSQGIVAGRLTARGYGETRPIESNRTSRGRATNRRVEFVRTDVTTQSDTP